MPIVNIHQKLTPCLWFDSNAWEAVTFYTTIFNNVEKGKISYYGPDMPMPQGSVLTIQFQIEGQEFLALNAGPQFKFNEAVSFMINCDTQDEIDYYWNKLTEDGGEASVCGWLKDKFGLSWQVVPATWGDMVADNDTKKVNNVMQAMMKMKKLDIAKLVQAYSGNPDVIKP
ncbi:VOC family protein [Flavobacterium sp.]|uniref:VOC family protein n=1 Tax=Flavobacterium sp. TaxID=239 RepID=UPI0025F35351|nr:VOC family protein [Flavobacterium sp.]